MRCLFCGKEKSRESLVSFFLEEDPLCSECRGKMKKQRKIITVGDMKVETYYDYEGLYRSLLIQYKECYDEALKDVFLYGLNDYIDLRYRGYRLALVPGSIRKKQERGFDHLELMCGKIRLKRLNGLRMKEERIQEGKSAEEREFMKHNYIYEGEAVKKVLILDDVMTTGSSLAGVCNALHGKADHIKVLSLAYKSKGLHYENKV